MSTNLQSIKGSWDTEIKRVRSNAKLVAAEVDDMNDDLKLINECWKADRDKIEELKKQVRELVNGLELLIETGDNVGLFKDNAKKLISKYK